MAKKCLTPTGMGSSLVPAVEDFELPKSAIFDLDGTLLDSVDLHAIEWKGSERSRVGGV